MLSVLTRFLVVVAAVVTAQSSALPHTISGRVQDARGQRSADVTLRVCTLGDDGGTSCGEPLKLTADGSFTTQPLRDGTYVLEAGPSPYSANPDPAIEHGLEVLRLSGRDLTGVVVRTTRYALQGRYVMRSDNPAAQWPRSIHLVALLVLGGVAFPVGVDGSTGAPNGEFLLENVLGPRVLRAGYSLGRDEWWPRQVLLDGVDVTDTPTDFSRHQNGRLEFVFTQHPARIAGQVVDADGRPVPGAWLIHFSADRDLWTDWASTTGKEQAVGNGNFSMAVRPGRYLVAALPPTPYQVRPTWPPFATLAASATSVTVADRGRADNIVIRLAR